MARLQDAIQRGTRSAQPLATAVAVATIYGVTDEGGILERSNGTTWQSYSPTIATTAIAAVFKAATVATAETQAASAAYGDLATPGPAVTITLTGTTAIIWMSAAMALSAAATNTAYISVAVSGASTVAASDTNSSFVSARGSGLSSQLGRVLYLTGLTAGSNTFTLKYHNDGGTTWTFANRTISVFAP